MRPFNFSKVVVVFIVLVFVMVIFAAVVLAFVVAVALIIIVIIRQEVVITHCSEFRIRHKQSEHFKRLVE